MQMKKKEKEIRMETCNVCSSLKERRLHNLVKIMKQLDVDIVGKSEYSWPYGKQYNRLNVIARMLTMYICKPTNKSGEN